MSGETSKSPNTSSGSDANERNELQNELKQEPNESSSDEEVEEDLPNDKQNIQAYREPERNPQFVSFPTKRELTPSNQKRASASRLAGLHRTSRAFETQLSNEKTKETIKTTKTKRNAPKNETISLSDKVKPYLQSIEKNIKSAYDGIRSYLLSIRNNKTTKTKRKNHKHGKISVNDKVKSYLPSILMYTVIPLLLIIGVYFIYDNSEAKIVGVDIEHIKEKFPKQDLKFWKSIVSGINSTIFFQRPTSYIFLYESEGEETTRRIIADVSKYAVYELTKSNYSAINFKEEILESPKFSDIHDYGAVLSHLQGKLEDNSLMIIENLDEVPEKYAKAFHYLCDEISPRVKKSAFFFTMKVDKFRGKPKDDLRNIEEALKRNWMNIKDDEFFPLITRISGMILNVYS